MNGDHEITRWSTSSLPVAERLDYWNGAVCEGFLEMSVRTPVPQAFTATLESAACGPLIVSRVRSCAADVYRTSEAIGRSSNHCFYLVATRDSPWAMRQGGETQDLLPRDVVLIDTQRRYDMHFFAPCETISIMLPSTWIEPWLPQARDAVGRRIDASGGWGAVLGGFVSQLSPESTLNAPLRPGAIADQLGGMLSLGFGEILVRSSRPSGRPLASVIVQRIREAHARIGLSAVDIGAELDISTRTLHRQLASVKTTFFQTLLACRITSASRMLRDPRFGRLSIEEVGRRCGFADASHFIRSYRGYTAATPLQVRKGHKRAAPTS